MARSRIYLVRNAVIVDHYADHDFTAHARNSLRVAASFNPFYVREPAAGRQGCRVLRILSIRVGFSQPAFALERGHSPIRAIVYAKEPDFWNKDCQIKSTDTGFRRCLLSWRGIGTNRLFVLFPLSGFFYSPVCRSWERPVDGSSDKPGGCSICLPPRLSTS